MTRLFIILSVAIIFFPKILYGFCFEQASKEFSVQCRLLESIAETESAMNPQAVHINKNGTFDSGLMQVNSWWITRLELDRGSLLSDPCYNVKTGARILRECIDRFGYNWNAVGCYNAGTADKKINYSWKIYHQLKNGMKSQKTNRNKPSSPFSSLSFEVKGKPEKGELP